MKNFKKVVAMALAVAMLVGVGVVANASSVPADVVLNKAPSLRVGEWTTYTTKKWEVSGNQMVLKDVAAVWEEVNPKVDFYNKAEVALNNEIQRWKLSGAAVCRIDLRDYEFNSLSLRTMRQLNNLSHGNGAFTTVGARDIVLTYIYQGFKFDIYIPAGTFDFESAHDWFGPLYLYGKYQSTSTVSAWYQDY